MKSKKLILISSAVLAASALTATAANKYFTRGTDASNGSMNWSDAYNWSSAAVTAANDYYNKNQTTAPGTGDRLVIASGSGYSGSNTSGDGYIVLNSSVTMQGLDVATYQPDNVGIAKGIKGTGNITLTGATGNVMRLLVANTNAGTTNFTDFDIAVNMTLHNANTATSGIGMYWRSGATLTFSGDTFTVTYAGTDYRTTFDIYAGNNENNFSEGNSHVVFDTKLISQRIKQTVPSYLAGSKHGYTSEVTMKGNVSNDIGVYCVTTEAILNLAKTGGAYAFGDGNTLEIIRRASVNLLGNGQFSKASKITFAIPESAANNKAGTLNMNGFSAEIGTLLLTGQVSTALSLTFDGSIEAVIDFGANSATQVFSMENGISAETVGTNLSLDGTQITVKNFNVGEDKILSGVKLSEQYLGDVSGTDIFSIDLFVFEGYDMNDYQISEVFNGAYWEYTLIPEPSTVAAIFGALALGFAACRRRKN